MHKKNFLIIVTLLIIICACSNNNLNADFEKPCFVTKLSATSVRELAEYFELNYEHTLFGILKSNDELVDAAKEAIYMFEGVKIENKKHIEVSPSNLGSAHFVQIDDYLVAFDPIDGELLLCLNNSTGNSKLDSGKFAFWITLDLSTVPSNIIRIPWLCIHSEAELIDAKKYYGSIATEAEARVLAYQIMLETAFAHGMQRAIGDEKDTEICWNDNAKVWVGTNHAYWVIIDPVDGECLFAGK
jgi:hypothetical protein